MNIHKWHPILFFALATMLASVVVACEPPAPAEFELVSLDTTPQEVLAGEEVTITAEVRNTGGRRGTHSVELVFHGAAQTESVKVAPGQTETVSFTVVSNALGSQTVRVDGMTSGFRVLMPAGFSVRNLVITPFLGVVGQEVLVAADVTNTGEIEGKHSVSLTIDGSQLETKQVTLAPGATETVSFPFTPDAGGTCSVEVGELSGVLRAIEADDAVVELSTALPELLDELGRLPDLKEIDDRDLEAIEDIAELALNPKYGEAFESMLDEGIKGKRKYCTPLEALLWVGYDRELEGYYALRPYSLRRLIGDAWKHTTTSDEYNSERWQDFDEVVGRLNSPDLVSTYMQDNIEYQAEAPGQNINQRATTTFAKKAGDCEDHAMFATYMLRKNGYQHDDFGRHATDAVCIFDVQWGQIGEPVALGHAVCLYKLDGLFFYLDNSGYKRGSFG